ncbi:MAG: pilus assembly protein TadG-related protein [Kiloniellaceae bacterium]
MRSIATTALAAIGRAGESMARPLKRARCCGARLWRDTHANITVLFGFGAIAIVGGVGLAIDTSVAYNVRAQLAAAADAAALAGARAFASPNRDADIQNFFNANFENGYMGSVLEPLEVVTDNDARTVTVTARVTIPTFFMSVFGTDSTDIFATAEATLSSRDVEVSLVLDVTGSMAGQRIVDLRDAANELVDIVVQDLQVPFYSKVAVVPYSSAVNVGAFADQVRGTYTAGATCTYPTEPTCETFNFQRASDGDWTEFDISSCVTERTGAQAYTDAAPSTAFVGRHFPPPGSYNPCLTPEIVPLSSNKTALYAAIDALQPAGSTAGQIGVAWGWYMVSPNFGYLFPGEGAPVPYGTVNLGQEVMKVVIIMTDGQFNTVYFDGVNSQSSTSGSGSSNYKINQNATNGNAYTQAETLCDNMKAEGVKVYTVGLDISSSTAVTDLMNNCATDAEHVYLPETGTELKQAFKDIAVQVSNLRISM